MAVTTSSVGNFLAAAVVDEQQSSFLVSMRVLYVYYHGRQLRPLWPPLSLSISLERIWKTTMADFFSLSLPPCPAVSQSLFNTTVEESETDSQRQSTLACVSTVTSKEYTTVRVCPARAFQWSGLGIFNDGVDKKKSRQKKKLWDIFWNMFSIIVLRGALSQLDRKRTVVFTTCR